MNGGNPHSAHASGSVAARELARRLLAATPGPPPDDAALLASVERMESCILNDLARWFGPFGSFELVTRALALARHEHPALSVVTVSGAPLPRLVGLASSTRTHGAAAAAAAIISVLAALLELLGRLIGDDLALLLVEGCGARTDERPSPASHDGGARPLGARARTPSETVLPDARAASADATHLLDEP